MRSLKNIKFILKVLWLEILGYNLMDVYLLLLGEKYVIVSMVWNVIVMLRKRKGISRMKWENNFEEKKLIKKIICNWKGERVKVSLYWIYKRVWLYKLFFRVGKLCLY